MTMEELTQARPTFKALLYGDSGVGKTVHAIMMAQEITPPDKRIMYIDTAEGWVSLENHKELKPRVDRMRYVNLNQIDALCQAMKEQEGGFDTYGTVIFDESSSAADTALDEVLKYRASQDRSKDPDTPTQPDFNTATNKVRKSYMDMLTIPGVNVIMIAHVRKDKDNRNIEVQAPSFMPKLGGKLRQPMHLVAHMSGNELSDDKYVRVFQVHPTRTIVAKTRIGDLPPQVEYDELITKVKGWIGGTVPDNEDYALVPDVETVSNIEGD